ncbi:MAG TPA: T9SS type A sorting domain-containing protein [Bacteroidia bacterium]|jgi:uncharacterized repeat protein (TIGR03803 family)|nr:T9SS type A sorting domain-containing protein [Bacteroidia bacterium]
MKKYSFLNRTHIKFGFILLFTLSSSLFIPQNCEAQYTDLYNFTSAGGQTPYGNVTLIGNTLYGMTCYGGGYGYGNIFSVHTDGTGFRDLFDFNGTNGANPSGSLTLLGGKFYGMTYGGGVHTWGAIFSIDTNGTGFQDLFSFYISNYAEGGTPYGSLTLAGKKFYGMARAGGNGGYGVLFSFDTNGTNYKLVYNFGGPNGSHPHGDVICNNGVLYGMTEEGGAHQDGIVFSVDTDGTNFKDLLDFNDTNGQIPYGDLILIRNKLYGMTLQGGASLIYGLIFSINTDGTGYKDMLDFTNANGAAPNGSLVLSGNLLYGTASEGLYGVIFTIDTSGNNYTIIHHFNDTLGEYPENSLTQSGSIFYGTALGGGTFDHGIIFKFDTNNISTSINKIAGASGSVDVYPNPSNGIFTVALSHAELVSASQTTVVIYDVLGEKVYSQFLIRNSQFVIDLSNQPSGIYLYRVSKNDGTLLGEGKLVIQK